MFIVKTEHLLLVSGSTVPNLEMISETGFLLAWIGSETASLMRFDAYCNLLAIRNGTITKTKEEIIIQAFDPNGYEDLQTYGGLIEEAIKTYHRCDVINPIYTPETYTVNFVMHKKES